MLDLFFFISLYTVRVYAQKKIILTDNSDDYAIDTSSYILFDPGKKLTIRDVAFGKKSSTFQLIKKVKDNLGYRKDAIWIRFDVNDKSTQTKKWILSLNYAVMDKVLFYDMQTDSSIKVQRAGILYPMSVRKIKSRLIVFPLLIKPNNESHYFIRIESGAAIPVNLEIYSAETFYKKGQESFLILGIFYGSLIIMALYNLFLFLSIKDLSYLFYSGFVLCMGYYRAILDGLNFRFFSPNNPSYNLAVVTVSVGFVILFGSLFEIKYLNVKYYSKTLNNIYKIFISIVAIFIVWAAIVKPLSSLWTSYFGLTYFVFSIIGGVYCWAKGNDDAPFFLIAKSMLIVGGLIVLLDYLKILNYPFLQSYGIQIGILFEVALFSFALGNRINKIKHNQEVEKSLIRGRIANDLHEEIGSNLNSISMSSHMIVNDYPLEPNEKKQLEDIEITVRETADSIRDIIWFINPEHDKIDDLVLKMKDTAGRLLHEINYTFLVDDMRIIKSRGLQFSRNLFLIYKEILTNVVKHSNAKNVKIAFEDKGKIWEFKVEDDGIGFEEDKIKYGEGIRNIRNRAKSLGVNVLFNSQLRKGTVVSLLIKR